VGLHASEAQADAPVGPAVPLGLGRGGAKIIVHLAELHLPRFNDRIARTRIAILNGVGDGMIVVEGLQPDAARIGDAAAVCKPALAGNVRMATEDQSLGPIAGALGDLGIVRIVNARTAWVTGRCAAPANQLILLAGRNADRDARGATPSSARCDRRS